jgi:hypothetical protein
MKHLIKKLFAISIISLFLFSGLTTAAIFKTEYTKSFTIYRHGPDGSIKPVKIFIDLNKDQSISDALYEKCKDLFLNDEEMLSVVNDNRTVGMISFTFSYGKGYHFKSVIRIPVPLTLRHRIFSTVPLRNMIALVYCNYENDDSASTKITEVTFPGREDMNTTTINGRHLVMSYGFFGYTGWLGRTSYFGDYIGRFFAGYNLMTVCIRYP